MYINGNLKVIWILPNMVFIIFVYFIISFSLQWLYNFGDCYKHKHKLVKLKRRKQLWAILEKFCGVSRQRYSIEQICVDTRRQEHDHRLGHRWHRRIIGFSILAMSESESAHLNLVAVAATGTRFYFSCTSINNPLNRPQGLHLVYVRLPPGTIF